MVATRETYTAISPWNSVQLADLFKDAFIDAGYMTDWYDEFLVGGIENRVVEIVYDGAKQWGKAYYWLQFADNTVHLGITSGWDTATNVPVGTTKVDFLNGNPAANSRMHLLATLNTNTTVTFTRWTSGVEAIFSYFLLKNGTAEVPFHINKTPPVSWIDLDAVMYHAAGTFRVGRSNAAAWGGFQHYPLTVSRSWVGMGGDGAFSNTSQLATVLQVSHAGFTHKYFISGGANPADTIETNQVNSLGGGVYLPVGNPFANPEYATAYNPVFSNLLLSLYSPAVLPSDFGFVGYKESSVMSAFDQYVVTAGTEVYDIITVDNASAGAPNGRLSAVFMARVT
jgi:hypothetical protein